MYDSAEEKGLNPGAIVSGWLTAVSGLGCAVLILALLLWQMPLDLQAERWLGLGLGALAAFAGGVRAGRRGGGSGLIHGLLAGMLLLLTQVALAGIWAGLPDSGSLFWMTVLSMGACAAGGVLGVNLGR